ncbi:hypothetical protein EAF04_010317 [Stromatinia cepivora]|nr:hypothetical protein EAF04_010317 [Stromatinia cepivora]
MSFHSPYTPLSWTTGYRASRPFEPVLPSPSQYPLNHPVLPPRYFAPPPHPASQTQTQTPTIQPPPPPQQPTPFYLTQLHLSRPPTIPNPFPHPIPAAPTSRLLTLLSHLAHYFQRFSNCILLLFSTIPLVIFHVLATIQPYYVVLMRYVREFEWRALFIAFVVFFFMPQGPGCGEGEENGGYGYGDGTIGIGIGRGEVEIVMEPAYVIAVRNCRSMGGLLGAGGKGEVLVV